MFNPFDFILGRLFRSRPATSLQHGYEVNPYTANPQAVDPTEDTIRNTGWVPPSVRANDLDDYGNETDEMRRAYRDYHRREPAIRSALEGLVASIADADVAVMPDDENHEDDCAAAELVNWTVEKSPHGWDGLIRRVLLGALIDGWSFSEITLRGIESHRKWAGYWGLQHVKNKDTAHLRMRIDAYYNVLGVVNTVRGYATYPARKGILFTHADIYDNPFGSSELRACHRAAVLIENAYQLWAFALNAYSGPFLIGKVGNNERRQQMEAALKQARAGGYIAFPKDDEVAVLNLASAASFDAFERKVDKLREEMYMAIRGAYLPFMQGTGSGGETRGNAVTSKGAGSDPRERVISKAVGRCISQQLCPCIVVPNFGPRVGIPRVILGGVDWQETKEQLEVAKSLLLDFQRPLSSKWLYKVGQTPPPISDDDAVLPPATPSYPPPNPLGFSEHFSEDGKKKVVPLPLANDFTLPGAQGPRLTELLGEAARHGREALAALAADIARRAIATGHVGFTDAESQALAEAIEAAIVPADLLGRARVVRFAELVQRQDRMSFADDPEPLNPFDKPPPPLTSPHGVDYFKRLIPALALNPDIYGPVMQEQAATLAALTQQTLADKIRAAITRYLGTDWSNPPKDAPTGARVVQQVLDEVGVAPPHGQYAELIFRTNVMDAYHTGLSEQLAAPETQAALPVWEYLIIDDDRTGDDHRPKGGRYYSSAVSFAQARGPRIWNCRCSAAPLSAAAWARLQAEGAQLSTPD